jgi:hypothetical protein
MRRRRAGEADEPQETTAAGRDGDRAWMRPADWTAEMPERPPAPGEGPTATPSRAGGAPPAPQRVVPILPGRSALTPNAVPRPTLAPSAAPPASPLRRGRVLAVVVVLVLLLAGTMVGAQRIVEDVYATSDAAAPLASNTLPPFVVTRDPTVATTTTTAAPKLDLLLLKGRPKPVTSIDPAVCDRPLTGSSLTITDFRPWALAPPAATPLTEEQVRAEITTVMRRRFRNDDPDRAVADAMKLFDSQAIRDLAGPEISLRGALVELKGTIGEPALAFVLSTPRPLTLRFGTTRWQGVEGEAWGDGYSLQITMTDRMRYERPALMAPIVFHELLHQNGAAYQLEELTNNTLDARMMIEALRDYPEALAVPTELGTATRTHALAQLNTRVGTQMTLARSDGATVYPNTVGPQPKTFEEAVLAPYPADAKDKNPYAEEPREPTPGHLTLTQVLASMADDGSAPAAAQFDEATIDFLDHHPGVDNCTQLVAAQALGVLHDGSAGQRAAQNYLATQPR